MTILMPSEGDMSLVSQDKSSITLKPIFYGGEACGPILRMSTDAGDISYRVKIRPDGRLELKKADVDVQQAAPNEA